MGKRSARYILKKEFVFRVYRVAVTNTVHFVFFLFAAFPVSMMIGENTPNRSVFQMASAVSVGLTVVVSLLTMRFPKEMSRATQLVLLATLKYGVLLLVWLAYYVWLGNRDFTIEGRATTYTQQAALEVFSIGMVAIVPLDVIFTKLTHQIDFELDTHARGGQ